MVGEIPAEDIKPRNRRNTFRNWCSGIAEDKGFTVHLFECGEGDHVHCFVSAPPKLSITAIVKYLKGITGQKTVRTFSGNKKPSLWKGELWKSFLFMWKRSDLYLR